MKTIFFVVSFFIAFIMANGLALYIKYIVWQKGYKTDWLSRGFGEIVNLHKMVGREKSLYQKRTYQLLLLAFYLFLLLVLVSFFMMAVYH
ncbi:MAG: hypothetical protein WA821_19260 [Anaerolineales bacterium]